MNALVVDEVIVRWIVGADVSEVNVSMLDAALPMGGGFTDDTTSAGTATVTEPSEVGFTLKVNVVPEPDTFVTVAFVAVTLDEEKPLTGAENVAVTGIVAAFVTAEVGLVSATVGPACAATANWPSPIAPVSTASDVAIDIARDLIRLIYVISVNW